MTESPQNLAKLAVLVHDGFETHPYFTPSVAVHVSFLCAQLGKMPFGETFDYGPFGPDSEAVRNALELLLAHDILAFRMRHNVLSLGSGPGYGNFVTKTLGPDGVARLQRAIEPILGRTKLMSGDQLGALCAYAWKIGIENLSTTAAARQVRREFRPELVDMDIVSSVARVLALPGT